ncbi:MAG TPA: SRPBCC family protein [Thermomicrobiales bacterium]|nr:SRPBCC family protein [Thermomicrobiales bacterium]
MTRSATGRIASSPAGQSIVLERTFNAPIGDVWKSVTEPERMNRWIGTWKGTAGTGKQVSFAMTAEGDVDYHPVDILLCDEPHQLIVDSIIPGFGTWHLTLELVENEGVTTLTFSHLLASEENVGSFAAGWEYYIDRLVATYTGEEFADFGEYYPDQSPYWEEAYAAAVQG